VVTDHVGKTLSDIRVALTGAMSREGTTSRDGALTLEGLRPGTYRLRFEAADFITLEREVTVKTGPAAEVDVSLDRAPAKPPEPPAPAQPTNCGSAIPADPNATIDVLSLPDWYGSNQAKDNDPPKETSVGHTAVMTPAVIQVNKQPITNRVRDDADQLLYVIAGQGVIRTRAMERSLGDGFLAIVPRGVTYTLERRGRTPLVVLSVVNK
jgi:mannose-6-phosphate isomerase-like protein (cupin superfamily)